MTSGAKSSGSSKRVLVIRSGCKRVGCKRVKYVWRKDSKVVKAPPVLHPRAGRVPTKTPSAAQSAKPVPASAALC